MTQWKSEDGEDCHMVGMASSLVLLIHNAMLCLLTARWQIASVDGRPLSRDLLSALMAGSKDTLGHLTQAQVRSTGGVCEWCQPGCCRCSWM